MNNCGFCTEPLYIRREQIMRPILAPATYVESLEQEITEKTGLVYIQVKNKYCPMCGRKVAKDG